MCGNCFDSIRKNDNSIECSICATHLHPSCASNGMCDTCMIENSNNVQESKVFTLPDVIRRSHVELYRKCPYSFYLEVIKGQESPDTIYTKLGIDVHDLFDKHAREEYPMEQMKKEYAALWQEYPESFFESVDKDKMWKRAMTSIETFYTIAKDLPKKAHTLEEKIIFPIAEGLPSVSITMDRIDEVAGELHMLDWKTGKVMVGKQLGYDMQAPLYIHAVKQHFGKPVRSFTFYYLNENKYRVFERRNDDEYVCTVGKREYVISITKTLREVNTIFSRIKNNEFNVPNDTRGMFFTCKMCAQKANGSCKGADEQAWRNSRREEVPLW